MSETNKAVIRRLVAEVFNRGSLEILPELVAEDFEPHDETLPPGRAAFVAVVNLLRTAFPDLCYTIDDLLADGDKTVTHVTVTGTHRGELMGVPPTGRPVSWSEIHITRFAGGRMAEDWDIVDQLAILRQIGAVPTPGAAAPA